MPSKTNRSTNLLLTVGALAGPFFVLVFAIQDLTRPGFHPLRCQVSYLAIGDFGWVQAINFFVTGALTLTLAFGLLQALRPRKVIPLLVMLVGIGFTAATFFATEPAYGCPSTIRSVPPSVTINGPIHDAAAGLVYIGFLAASLLYSRHALQQGNRGFAIYSAVSAVAAIACLTVSSLGYAQMAGLLDVAGLFERLALLSMFAWMTALTVTLSRGQHAPGKADVDR